MTTRTLEKVIESIATSDGAGVKLRRSIGSSQFQRLDPFLMNTREEIEQAIRDYQSGELTRG